MTDFITQLKNLKIKDKGAKPNEPKTDFVAQLQSLKATAAAPPPKKADYEGPEKPNINDRKGLPPPYYDPTGAHIHRWQRAGQIRLLKHEQDPTKKYYSDKHPVVKGTGARPCDFCSLCHKKKKGFFRMTPLSGEMPESYLFSDPAYVEEVVPEVVGPQYVGDPEEELVARRDELRKQKHYNKYTERELTSQVEVIQTERKKMERIKSMEGSPVGELQVKLSNTYLDAVQGHADAGKLEEFKTAYALLFVSYTITRDQFALQQMQAMINDCPGLFFGIKLTDHVGDHNRRTAKLNKDFDTYLVIKRVEAMNKRWRDNKTTYKPTTRPKMMEPYPKWMRPFPRVTSPYIRVAH